MMNKKGRFEYDYNTDCWVCVSCGHRIPNERMRMLKLIPYCPNCDFRNSKPITYEDLSFESQECFGKNAGFPKPIRKLVMDENGKVGFVDILEGSEVNNNETD